jgi:hypothetical protein
MIIVEKVVNIKNVQEKMLRSSFIKDHGHGKFDLHNH